MKKILALFLIIIVGCTSMLAACGGGDAVPTTDPTKLEGVLTSNNFTAVETTSDIKAYFTGLKNSYIGLTSDQKEYVEVYYFDNATNAQAAYDYIIEAVAGLSGDFDVGILDTMVWYGTPNAIKASGTQLTDEEIEEITGSVPMKSDPTHTVPTHTATIVIKDYGTIELELYGNAAPITVENFEALANSGFYDGLTFHRIIEGFMMQGGDPAGNGSGGSENEIKGEFTSNGVNNSILHTRGVISMARSGDPDSASSQFFIMHADATHLDGDYAAFGRVTSGMDVVDKVCTDAKPTDNNGTIPSSNQPVIESIRVEKVK